MDSPPPTRLASPAARTTSEPDRILRRSLENDRVHSAYIVSGAGSAPVDATIAFVRALVCTARAPEPCEACRECRRSQPDEAPIALDGEGKKGPLLRHVGDHPDLFWIERGAAQTRVSIKQVRELQRVLQLASSEGGRRAAVIADADLLNAQSENALLKLLEEPPRDTTLVLVTPTAGALLPTIRSRCVRVAFPAELPIVLRGEAVEEDVADLVERFDAIGSRGVADLLAWAEDYRGARAVAAEQVTRMLDVGYEWLRARVKERAAEGGRVRGELDAARVLAQARRDLVVRNANPQMVAERALLAVREGLA